MNDDDIARLRAATGIDFVPVFTVSSWGGVSLQNMMKSYQNDSDAYGASLTGFVDMSASALSSAGLTVTGRMPTADNEIAVSKFIYDQFNHYGFNNAERAEVVNAGSLTMTEGANGLLGKHIKLPNSAIHKSDGTDYEYVIVGVVDTQFDAQRYEKFLPSDDPAAQAGNATAAIADLLLQMELQDTLTYGFHTLGFVTSGAIADMAANANFSGRQQNVGTYTSSLRIVMERGSDMGEYASFYRVASNEDMADVAITWLDGNARTTLGEKEFVISNGTYMRILGDNVSQNLSAETINQASRTILQDAGADPDSFGWEGDATYALLQQEAIRAVYQQNLLDNATFVADLRRDRGYDDATYNAMSAADKKWNAYDYYNNYLRQNYWNSTSANRYVAARTIAAVCSEALTAASINPVPAIRTYTSTWDNSGNERKLDRGTYNDWTVVGVFDENAYDGSLIVSQTLYDLNETVNAETGGGTWRTVRAKHTPGIWAFAVAPMPVDSKAIEQLVNISYFGLDGIRYTSMTKEEKAALTEPDLEFSMQNQVMNTLDNFNDFIETGAKIFLYVGIGFAVFSGLLLMNFISISISYKKREIGILRAVGARSSDVFKIFFSESLIIALINYVLAIAATLTAIFVINRWMRGEGINVTLLNFGLRQLGLMLAVSVGVALLSSFLPVWRIARKKPVDAIKDR